MTLRKLSYIILLLFPALAHSQQQIGSASIFPFLDIRSIIIFDVSVTGKGLEYDFKSSDQLSSGLVGNNIFRARVKSNQNWIMSVHADSPTFLNTMNNRPSGMPCNIIGIRAENKANFVTIGVDPVGIASGYRGNDKRNGNTFSMDMEVTPGDFSEAGRYYLNLIFTITPD